MQQGGGVSDVLSRGPATQQGCWGPQPPQASSPVVPQASGLRESRHSSSQETIIESRSKGAHKPGMQLCNLQPVTIGTDECTLDGQSRPRQAADQSQTGCATLLLNRLLTVHLEGPSEPVRVPPDPFFNFRCSS
ncbi:hypothetical protein NDU88_008254 [Pleurodeles waltl]|uniref:Uncharacterized protein n=1 Tax=Pleurodeles waltl TaxID=8319 RepID=A0AAV7QR90_PLEWA|nr:hypothetical protein NDU88_008254 [Pleurodeles waltl]